ncbi:hypothetical protein AC1031_006361 [Aphanomyces cochlioides]|nr:hypothetical protein AC1031_006361 [Aphanomyces cochlioides]
MEFVVAFPEFGGVVGPPCHGLPKVDKQTPRSRRSAHELTLVTSWEPILHDIQSHYAFGQTLGEGSFSIVKAAVQATTGKTFAIKCIRKHDLDAKHMEFLGHEIDFLKMVRRPP